MPLRLDIKEVLRKPSERVKSVDLHPTEPWILAGLYDGNVIIYNIETGKVVKAFEIAPGTPVRCARLWRGSRWWWRGRTTSCCAL